MAGMTTREARRRTMKAREVREQIADQRANETREEKFVRLANRRVNRVLRDLAMVANLGAPAYESTPKQRATIISTLQDAVEKCVAKLDKDRNKVQDGGFMIMTSDRENEHRNRQSAA